MDRDHSARGFRRRAMPDLIARVLRVQSRSCIFDHASYPRGDTVTSKPFIWIAWICLLAASTHAADTPVPTPTAPVEWTDADTGHRVVRLSAEPGTRSLYFHQNSLTPDGRYVIT